MVNPLNNQQLSAADRSETC